MRRTTLTLPFLAAALACSDGTTDLQPTAVAAVEITPSSVTVDEGDTVRVTVRVTDAEGNDLTGRTVIWASADPSTATVVDGLVTGVLAGPTSVTATADGVADTADVTVLAVTPAVPSLALIAEGFTLPTYATTPPAEADRLFVTELAGRIHLVDGGTRLPTPFLDLTSVTGC
ncbi:MAG: Ig-like domain-containing protein, partial [Gemmatimonadota bacterium]|nr:Ig-like domain-containing protein [Gemmatimonadota bacterium]